MHQCVGELNAQVQNKVKGVGFNVQDLLVKGADIPLLMRMQICVAGTAKQAILLAPTHWSQKTSAPRPHAL